MDECALDSPLKKSFGPEELLSRQLEFGKTWVLETTSNLLIRLRFTARFLYGLIWCEIPSFLLA